MRGMIRRGLSLSVPLSLCAAAAAGCCPLGDAVLETLTLPPEELTGTCVVQAGPSVVSDPVELLGDDRTRIPDRSTAAAISELVGPAGAVGGRGSGVRYAYAAEYGCGPGDGNVGVAAVMFSDPIDAARAARLELSPMEVIYRGQLAAIVWTRGPGCDDCYRTLRARAERIIGREE